MTTQNLYVDVNVLQTVPSSNINRDDTGAPKTALYGGVTRARVSSQSWKRAMRNAFKDDGQTIGWRTKKANTYLVETMLKIDSGLEENDATDIAARILELLGSKPNDKNSALIFISQVQIERLAQYAVDNSDKLVKEFKKANNKISKKIQKEIWNSLEGDNTLDLALFGRMFASAPALNIDAAAQVAHAISTHEVVPEFDYFTAMDDLKTKDESGAAMVATGDFNSATLYRYANLNLNELVANLNVEDAPKVAATFIKEFILTMPTGKQNSYANKTLPNYVMVTLRTDTPVNLVSAFENPVRSEGGYVQESIDRLEAEYGKSEGFVSQPVLNLILGKSDSNVGESMANINELLDKLTEKLSEVIRNENSND